MNNLIKIGSNWLDMDKKPIKFKLITIISDEDVFVVRAHTYICIILIKAPNGSAPQSALIPPNPPTPPT